MQSRSGTYEQTRYLLGDGIVVIFFAARGGELLPGAFAGLLFVLGLQLRRLVVSACIGFLSNQFNVKRTVAIESLPPCMSLPSVSAISCSRMFVRLIKLPHAETKGIV